MTALKTEPSGLYSMGTLPAKWNVDTSVYPSNTLDHVLLFSPGIFVGIVGNFRWDTINPSDGVFNFSSITAFVALISSYNVAHQLTPLKIRLRVWTGVYAPAWAMVLNDGGNPAGPVTIYQARSVPPNPLQVGNYWSVAYLAKYFAMQTALASSFDAEPLITSVSFTGTGSLTDEPANDPIDDASVVNLIAAGRTDARMYAALLSAIPGMSAWNTTLIEFTQVPNILMDSGDAKNSPASTISLMASLRAVGPQWILANHAIQVPLQKTELKFYPSFLSLGPPTSGQTAQAMTVAVVALARSYGMTIVELHDNNKNSFISLDPSVLAMMAALFLLGGPAPLPPVVSSEGSDMSILQNYLDDVQSLIHDASNASWTQAQLIKYINTAREDVALDMHCVRHLTTGVQLIQGTEIYSINGAVCGANLTAGGTGYSAATTVTFGGAPAGGITATGMPVIVGGVVTAINMTKWGQGYTAAPLVAISDGAGSGATATAITFLNCFQVISISNIWNLRRYMLGFRGFTLFQAYMRTEPDTFNAPPGIWTIHPQDLNVYLRQTPDQLYSSEWDVLSLPAPLVNTTDVDSQIVPPWSKAVQFRAAALALMKHQNFSQAQFYEEKYEQRVPRYIIGAGGIRIPNPYNRSFQRKIARGAS